MSWLERNAWSLAGLTVLVGGFVWALLVVSKDSAVFQADGSFATLAGFTVLALALERLSEAVLAPWWGKASPTDVKNKTDQAPGVKSALPAEIKTLLDHGRGLTASQALAVKTSVRAASDATIGPASSDSEASNATAAVAAADSAWVKATQDRPTLLLPAAAIATVIAAYFHLFLLHSIAHAAGGLPTTQLAFAIDALLTGLAVAGGAKPFHDLAESIAASSATKQASQATGAK